MAGEASWPLDACMGRKRKGIPSVFNYPLLFSVLDIIICKVLITVFCYCLYTIDITSMKSVQSHFQCIHDLRECVCVVHVASYLVSPPSFCMYVHVTNTEFLGTVRLFNLD